MTRRYGRGRSRNARQCSYVHSCRQQIAVARMQQHKEKLTGTKSLRSLRFSFTACPHDNRHRLLHRLHATGCCSVCRFFCLPSGSWLVGCVVALTLADQFPLDALFAVLDSLWGRRGVLSLPHLGLLSRRFGIRSLPRRGTVKSEFTFSADCGFWSHKPRFQDVFLETSIRSELRTERGSRSIFQRSGAEGLSPISSVQHPNFSHDP